MSWDCIHQSRSEIIHNAFPKRAYTRMPLKCCPVVRFLSTLRFCPGNRAEINIEKNIYMTEAVQIGPRIIFCLISCNRMATNQGLQTKVQQYYIIWLWRLSWSLASKQKVRECLRFWATHFQGLHNGLGKLVLTRCLFAVEMCEGRTLQVFGAPLPVCRKREDTVGLHMLKKNQRMSWSNCRDFWDTCDARDVPETQECLPSGSGLPCQWHRASSVRAIKRVSVTKCIVFNHLFLKLFKFSSLSFFSPHELSFVYVLRSCLLLWSEFLSWHIFLQWLAIVLISH